ncbi:MAG: DNA replication and repair protein RecF [Bacteroidia bacterium]|nr:MAG: DNA replication and repair protein RecF [Bacteroidia bacterium]
MFLKHLHVLYFKNIEDKQLDFSKKFIAFVGNNGIGKTNVLDSIYYLSMTKSYFSSTEVQNIQFGKEFFVIYGKFENQGMDMEVSCSVRKSEGKQVLLNQKPYPKITEHIGKIPVVIITPQDLYLITEYADTRRKFLDALISKFDKDYLNALIQYNKALQQRNALLKQEENVYQQMDLLDIYGLQMAQYGEMILNKRKLFFEEVKEKVKKTYSQLQNSNELLELNYISTIQNDYFKELQNSIPKDIRLGYTSLGIHRDDFEILLNGYAAKNFASQGQQKTIIIALKWLELLHIFQKTNVCPILLLDDIYDKMDDQRLNQFVDLLNADFIKQVFVTDTNKERILKLFNTQNVEIFEMK